MLFKYYYFVMLHYFLALPQSFFSLSIDDPGLPRSIKSCAFGIFYYFFFLIMNLLSYVLFLLVFIGDQAI